MSDIAQLLAEDDTWADGDVRGGRSLQPRPWWAWTLGAMTLGFVALLAAGALLADARLGTALRVRACDTQAVPAVVLLVLGGLLLSLAFTCSRLHHHGAILRWDASTLAVALPAPATLLALTLPGLLGCAAASDVSDLPLVGEALVGQAGSMLAAVSAALVGAALGSGAHVSVASSASASGRVAPPGIVELAMQEAEAVEAAGIASRYRGVDSGE